MVRPSPSGRGTREAEGEGKCDDIFPTSALTPALRAAPLPEGEGLCLADVAEKS